MSTVRYETGEAIFYFDRPDVQRILKHLTSKNHVPEASKLLEKISSRPADLILLGSSYFRFIILELLKDGGIDTGEENSWVVRMTKLVSSSGGHKMMGSRIRWFPKNGSTKSQNGVSKGWPISITPQH
jgi:hypothetical protein